MELIVLNIALDLGVIDATFFTMMVIMALVTTFMTTPLLRWIYPPTAMMAADLVEPVEAPVHAMPAFTVLACPFEAQTARSMHRLAAGLGGDKALLVAAHVTRPPIATPINSTRSSATINPPTACSRSSARAPRPCRSPSGRSLHQHGSGRRHPRLGRDRDADLIVLEGHRPLFSNSWLGGMVGQVVDRAKSPVGILFDRKVGAIRSRPRPLPRHRARSPGAGPRERLMANAGAQVTVLHVIRPRKYSNWPLNRESARATLEAFQDRHGEVVLKTIEHESPVLAALAESTRATISSWSGSTPIGTPPARPRPAARAADPALPDQPAGRARQLAASRSGGASPRRVRIPGRCPAGLPLINAASRAIGPSIPPTRSSRPRRASTSTSAPPPRRGSLGNGPSRPSAARSATSTCSRSASRSARRASASVRF